MSISEPVIVLYKSSTCGHCTKLASIWDKVTAAVKVVYPKMRFFEVTGNGQGKFDPLAAPKDLARYSAWFPMILLVPGKVWDDAVSAIAKNNDVEIKEGVEIMNAVWENNVLTYKQRYDIRKPEEFGKWVKEAMENKDFKRIQEFGIVVPTIKNNAPVARSTETPKVESAPTSFFPSTKTGSLKTNGDVCSMRIISRPK